MATRRKPMSEINVVPYIDVMLVLLVIFMVTAPLLTQGVEVNLPEKASDTLEDADDDPLVVTLKSDGSIYLNVGVSDFSEQGAEVDEDQLAEQSSKVFTARPDAPVFVRADKALEYGEVINVMTILQQSGALTVGLVTDPPEI